MKTKIAASYMLHSVTLPVSTRNAVETAIDSSKAQRPWVSAKGASPWKPDDSNRNDCSKIDGIPLPKSA